MKNDLTTTLLNVVLAALVILGVYFAVKSIWLTRDFQRAQNELQFTAQRFQYASGKAQALLNDTIAFNATARNPDLARIIQAAQTAAPAAK